MLKNFQLIIKDLLMIFKNKKILVIAAHPDDETIGCGATLSLAKKNGCSIDVLFLGEGVSARFPNKENSVEIKKSKKSEERNGAKKKPYQESWY